MARFEGFNVLKYGVIAFIASVIAFVVSAIFRAIPIPIYNYNNQWFSVQASVFNLDLRTQVETLSVFTEFGQKIMDFMGGVFSIELFITIVLGVSITLLIGRFITGFIKPTKFVLQTRVLMSFVLGAAIVGVLFIPLWISIVAYSLALGIIMQLLVNWKSLKWVSE